MNLMRPPTSDGEIIARGCLALIATAILVLAFWGALVFVVVSIVRWGLA